MAFLHAILTILTITTLTTLTSAIPLQARQEEDPAWSFSVYQSQQRCTGARDPYSGDGSQECTQGIRNGSFGSYIKGNIRPGCTVTFYNNANCDVTGIIDVLTSDVEGTCMQPVIEVTNAPSFDVVCE